MVEDDRLVLEGRLGFRKTIATGRMSTVRGSVKVWVGASVRG